MPSLGGYCQGVITYRIACRIACQASADTAKANIQNSMPSLGRYCQGVITYRIACQA